MANTNKKIDPLRREASNPKIFEGETVETRWDPKKIIIGAIILLTLGLLGTIMLTGVGKQSSTNDRETLGVTSKNEDGATQDAPSLPTRADIEKIIRETRETISNLTAENLTSSQAAIQKMISDLEKLREGKSTTAVFCDLICK